jgi:hypothetical protein
MKTYPYATTAEQTLTVEKLLAAKKKLEDEFGPPPSPIEMWVIPNHHEPYLVEASFGDRWLILISMFSFSRLPITDEVAADLNSARMYGLKIVMLPADA